MTDRLTLMQVQAENWRNNGGNGGVSPEVMEDIGFTPFDKFDDVIANASETAFDEERTTPKPVVFENPDDQAEWDRMQAEHTRRQAAAPDVGRVTIAQAKANARAALARHNKVVPRHFRNHH